MMNFNTAKSLLPILGLIITTLSSCEKEDGTSSCPDHYTGSTCTEQITPSKMFITKVEVVKFPATDPSGTLCTDWDCDGGADIFPELSLASGGSAIWESSTINFDADPNTSYSHYPSPLVAIEPKTSYAIRLFDYDSGLPNQFIGGISFTPYSSTGGFPETKTLDVGTGLVLKVSFLYEF